MGDLELLFHPSSSYSQRVIIALQEITLTYKTRIINLPNLENHEAWFMKINPRGQVPVLRDGEVYISDSEKIIKYIDTKYGSGYLTGTGTTQGKAIQALADKVSSVDAYRITFGSYFHQDLVHNPGYSTQFATVMAGKVSSGLFTDKLEKESSEHPDMALIYEEKINSNKERIADITDREQLTKALDRCKKILSDINGDLIKAGFLECAEDRWLIDDSFTLADIYLAVLLCKLVFCGYAKLMWEDTNLLAIQHFLYRVRQRESYQKAANKTH